MINSISKPESTPSPLERVGVRLKKLISILLPAMKRTLFCFIVLFSSTTKAQDENNCGILNGNILVDTISCWADRDFWVIFPVKEEWKKYDRIRVYFWDIKKENHAANLSFDHNFDNGGFFEEYGNGDLGGLLLTGIELKDGPTFKEKDNKKEPDVGKQIFKIIVSGRMRTGAYQEKVDYNGVLKREPIYGDDKHLWESQPITFISYFVKENGMTGKVKYNGEAQKFVEGPCSNKGRPFPFKKELVNYKKYSCIIKTGNSSTNNTSVKKDNVKTETKSNNTKTSTQTKPGYTMYLEKWDNGKVKVQGQKDKDDQLQGTWKYYDETGKLEKTEEWKDNELISTKEN